MKGKELAGWLIANAMEKEILVSCDEEGNAYGHVDPSTGNFASDGRNIILYPTDTILPEDL